MASLIINGLIASMMMVFMLGGAYVGYVFYVTVKNTVARATVPGLPSVDIIRALVQQGATVRAYDPVAQRTAQQALLDTPVIYCRDAYDAAEGCDAVVLVTDWNEFKSLDLAQLRAAMHRPVLIDGRNMFDPAEMTSQGFVYQGIGRASSAPSLKPTSQDQHRSNDVDASAWLPQRAEPAVAVGM